MTAQEFMKQVEDYYGSYPDGSTVKKFTTHYLNDFESSKLPDLLKVVFLNHPIRLGIPDMATIKNAHDKFTKDTGMSIIRLKVKTEYKETELRLTDEERAEVEPLRENWKEMLSRISKEKTVESE